MAALLVLTAAATARSDAIDLRTIFPFGIWYIGWITESGIDHATIAEDMEALGLDFVVTMASIRVAPDSDDPESVRSVLSAADKRGLKVLLVLRYLILNRTEQPTLAELLDSGQARELLAPFVEEGRKHPSLLGWSIGNEPTGEQELQVAEKLRLLLAELDPDHPSWTETPWSVLERDVYPHLRILTQDVFQPEVYPLWNHPYNSGLGDFSRAGFKPQDDSDDWMTVELVDHFREVRPHLCGRHVWPWIQSFGNIGETQPPNWDFRAPTPEELRALTWICLAEGSKGACWFSYNHMQAFKSWSVLAPEIKALIAAIRPLTPVLLHLDLTQNIAQASGGGGDYYDAALVETHRHRSGDVFLIVVNRNCRPDGEETVRVTVEDRPLTAGRRWVAAEDVLTGIRCGARQPDGRLQFGLSLRPGEGRLVRLLAGEAHVTGQCLLSRNAVSELTESLWEEYQAFCERDLSGFEILYLLVDAIYEPLRR